MLGKARQQERGQREANLAAVRSRGQLGSGLELAAMESANQDATNQAHSDALRESGMAEDRALQSILQSGKLGGEMDQRDFNQQFQKGSAADEIAKFNTQTRQRVQATNTDRLNEAQRQNLQAKQSVADRNVDLTNKQTQYNTETNAKAAQDELDKAKAVAAARNRPSAADLPDREGYRRRHRNGGKRRRETLRRRDVRQRALHQERNRQGGRRCVTFANFSTRWPRRAPRSRRRKTARFPAGPPRPR
jgi:hypothetical protein